MLRVQLQVRLPGERGKAWSSLLQRLSPFVQSHVAALSTHYSSMEPNDKSLQLLTIRFGMVFL